MRPLTVSDIAARHLEAWLDALMRGELELWQLPSSVRAFYDLGLADGRSAATQHLHDRIALLEHENDQLYIRAFHQEDARREEILRRLDEQAAMEADLIMTEMYKQLLGGNADSGRAAEAAESSEYDHTGQPSRRNLRDTTSIHRPGIAA